MVRIRLRRTGLKNQTTYRIMAAEKESPRDGRFLEILGSYNPRTNPTTVDIKEERVYDWMSKGAQPSESVVKIFKSVGLLDRYARFKAGESKDALLVEAKTAYEKHAVSSKAEKASLEEKKPSAKKSSKEKAAPAPTVETPKAANVIEKVESTPLEAADNVEVAPEVVVEKEEAALETIEEKEEITPEAAVKKEEVAPVEVKEKVEASPAEEKVE